MRGPGSWHSESEPMKTQGVSGPETDPSSPLTSSKGPLGVQRGSELPLSRRSAEREAVTGVVLKRAAFGQKTEA